jgi:hypothetical protein
MKNSTTVAPAPPPTPIPAPTPTPANAPSHTPKKLLFDIEILIKNADDNIVVKTRARCTGRLNFKLHIKNGASCQITNNTTDMPSRSKYTGDISWIVLDKDSGASFSPSKSKIGESVIFEAPDALNECLIRILFEKATGTDESDNHVEYYGADTVIKGSPIGGVGGGLSNNSISISGGKVSGSVFGGGLH